MADHPMMRCETCKWWSRDSSLAIAARLPEGSDPAIGACQIAPPELYRICDGFEALFPAVRAHRFCSQWEAGSDGGGGGATGKVINAQFGAAA